MERKILLGHGAGGALMHALIKELLLKKFDNPLLKELTDSAALNYKERIAFTTDSFVVSPLFFPGADIGKLSVCGTVNDLVMLGACPEFLSLSLIIEEGLDYKILDKITSSISRTAKDALVQVVTGDLKVVEKGAVDKIFINTAGLGRVITKEKISIKNISCGDKIIITGNIAQHGLSVLAARKGLSLGLNIKSDSAALNALILPVLKKTEAIKFMRDPTRGGVATTLNEIAQGAHLGIVLEEKYVPVTSKVRAAGELLGIDPLYIANEGIAIMVVDKRKAEKVLGLLKKHTLGRYARICGEIVKAPRGKVILKTSIGSERIIDMLSNEPLPRIC